MENTILTAARLEQQELEKQLAVIDSEYTAKKKAIVQRLEAVRSLRSVYGDAAPASDWFSVAQGLGEIATAFVKAQTARENSHKARVLAAAIDILKKDSPIRTPQLLAFIEARGIEFNAKDKAANLSVILSKDDRFVSDRKNGWSLAEKNPQDVPASAGSPTV